MPFSIDKSLDWDGIYKFSSDSGASYIVKLRESAPGSGLWTIDFIKTGGEPPKTEIFKTMKVLSDLCKEYINKVGGDNLLMLISGDSEESLQKSKVFTRWMGEEWESNITDARLKISGIRNMLYPTPYLISVKRKPKSIVEDTPKPISIGITSEIKFCYNCGNANNDYLYCPNCGTKLKQA